MMTTSSIKDLVALELSELQREIADLRKHLAQARISVVTGAEKDTAKFHREKKALARMLTALTQKKQKNA